MSESLQKHRHFDQAEKIKGVSYDLRGPVATTAEEMERDGHTILKLNTGNPAIFGFEAPDVIMRDMIANLPTSQGYTTSKGITSARRAVVTRKLKPVPVEAIARGYLIGSGWKDYQRTGKVSGIALPEGLRQAEQLPQPVFTPSTKAAVGDHDENIDFAHLVAIVGADAAEQLRDLSIAIYTRAEGLARDRGIILADTKVEFGRRADGTIVLADEVLTPDSSRFWPASDYRAGRVQPSYDKQIVRNWLLHDSGWDKASGDAPPALPTEVVERTRARYLEAYERLTGHPLELS